MRHLMHRHSRSLHSAETLVSDFIDLLGSRPPATMDNRKSETVGKTLKLVRPTSIRPFTQSN